MLMKFTQTLAASCFVVSSIYGDCFHLSREDGSLMTGYVALPKNEDFPIVVALQGTSRNSVYSWFDFLKLSSNNCNIAIYCIEQRGVYQDYTDLEEYKYFNSLNIRLNDYKNLIDYIQHSQLSGWNGQIWLLGESEGGILASQLLLNSYNMAGVILVGSGGGIPIKQELCMTMEKYLESQCISTEERDNQLIEFEKYLDIAKNHPSHKEFFLGNSTQWWSSLLNMTPISSALQASNVPVIVVHGTSDMHIPVQSADLLVDSLNSNNITNTYFRIESAPHIIRDSVIFEEIFSIITNDRKNFSIGYSKNYTYQEETIYDLFARGSGKVEVGASAQRDREGNSEKEVHIIIKHESDDGTYVKLSGAGRECESVNGSSQVEGRAQVDVGWTWGGEKKK